MKHTNLGQFRICVGLLAIAAIGITPQLNAASSSRLAGSYEVAQKIAIGPHAHVRLKLHLANRGSDNLVIRRLALWNVSHADKTSSQACNLVVPAGTSADFTQEFILHSSQLDLWKHGSHPQLLVQFQAPNGKIGTEVVSLEPAAGRKAN